MAVTVAARIRFKGVIWQLWSSRPSRTPSIIIFRKLATAWSAARLIATTQRHVYVVVTINGAKYVASRLIRSLTRPEASINISRKKKKREEAVL